jgi:hypothetical protein
MQCSIAYLRQVAELSDRAVVRIDCVLTRVELRRQRPLRNTSTKLASCISPNGNPYIACNYQRGPIEHVDLRGRGVASHGRKCRFNASALFDVVHIITYFQPIKRIKNVSNESCSFPRSFSVFSQGEGRLD